MPAQSCLTLCNPMDCSLPGSSVLGIFPVRIWNGLPLSSFRGSYQLRDRTCISCIASRFFTPEPVGRIPQALTKCSALCNASWDLYAEGPHSLQEGIKPAPLLVREHLSEIAVMLSSPHHPPRPQQKSDCSCSSAHLNSFSLGPSGAPRLDLAHSTSSTNKRPGRWIPLASQKLFFLNQSGSMSWTASQNNLKGPLPFFQFYSVNLFPDGG